MKNERLLWRCFVSALSVLVISGVLAILAFNVAAAILSWPGLIVVNAVCARFGIYLHDSPTWEWLVPGLLIDLFVYTAFFFVCAKLWLFAASRSRNVQTRPEGSLSPTTDDQRPTTVL